MGTLQKFAMIRNGVLTIKDDIEIGALGKRAYNPSI